MGSDDLMFAANVMDFPKSTDTVAFSTLSLGRAQWNGYNHQQDQNHPESQFSWM